MQFGARTDTGRVRENNEDSYRVAPEINLFVLSDGMGGQASGEVASRLAAETIIAHCRESTENSSLALFGTPADGVSDTSNRLASAIRLANRVVNEEADKDESRHGMGATVVAVWFSDGRMSLGHVGDSRIYRLRSGELEQLTQDHSFVAEQVRRGLITEQEASESKMQSVLLRALGIEPEVEVALDEQLVMDGDVVLLCSDGLTRELSDAQITGVLGETKDAKQAADRLVDLANEAGGGDNITAIVIGQSRKRAGFLARLASWFEGSGDLS
jgi:PPM family protein phosphatase